MGTLFFTLPYQRRLKTSQLPGTNRQPVGCFFSCTNLPAPTKNLTLCTNRQAVEPVLFLRLPDQRRPKLKLPTTADRLGTFVFYPTSSPVPTKNLTLPTANWLTDVKIQHYPATNRFWRCSREKTYHVYATSVQVRFLLLCNHPLREKPLCILQFHQTISMVLSQPVSSGFRSRPVPWRKTLRKAFFFLRVFFHEGAVIPCNQQIVRTQWISVLSFFNIFYFARSASKFARSPLQQYL